MTVIGWRHDGHCDRWDGITKIERKGVRSNPFTNLYREKTLVVQLSGYIKLEVI